MKTFKALAALLSYPEAALVAALPEIESVLREERLVGAAARTALARLARELRDGDLLDVQEAYVALFDRVRSLSLHLFEHVHGESRDRGQAMVDLLALYGRHGYALATDELPDYLPAFLEFLSYRPLDEALGHLADIVHLLDGVGARLAKRGSAYAAVFQALLELSGASCDAASVSDEDIRAEDDPAVLDALWQEQPAFGPGAGCGKSPGPSVAPITFHKGVAA